MNFPPSLKTVKDITTVFLPTQDGMTVLHLAARFGHVDVLEVLRGKVPWSMASVKVGMMKANFLQF